MLKKLNPILLTAAIMLYGCGIFETRPVEPPTEIRSTFIQPTSPDIVLTNLNYAVVEKNLDNYMRCFVDTNFSLRRFRFFPDAFSQSSFPVFNNWSLNNERVYYSNLISFTPPSSSSNLFPDNIIISTSIDSAIVDMNYIFVFEKLTYAQNLVIYYYS